MNVYHMWKSGKMKILLQSSDVSIKNYTLVDKIYKEKTNNRNDSLYLVLVKV